MPDAARLHMEMLEAVRSRDWDALRALYHPDYTYAASDGDEREGADAGVAVAQTYTTAFEDLSFEVLAQHAAGEVSVIEFWGRGTHTGDLPWLPATGRQVELMICNVVEVRDGKIHREREYYDALTMMRQLGAVPEGP